MKILHIMWRNAGVSGVVTFVRRLDAALRTAGVTSAILTEADPFPARIEADVVHIHGLWRPFYHRIAHLARRQGIPIVWSTHGMTAPWALRHKWLKKSIAWWLYQRRSLRRAALVHATSENEAGWNRARGLARACIVPLGADLPADWRRGVPRPEGQHTLLYVGRIYPVKALERLIAAFARVPESVRAGWTLRLVGPEEDASYAATLKQQVSAAGLDACCVFAGAKFGEALAQEYAACDALALVSLTENFGATVVDALAWGKPVVTSTATPWRCVSEAGCGWWVDNAPEELARTLAELMQLSNAERVEMGARGRALVESRYTWPSVAHAMMGAYDGVLCGSVF